MVWERDGMAGKEDAKVHSACLPLSLDAGETTCFCRAPGLISEQSDNEHSLHRSALLQRCASAVQHCRLFDSRLHSGCCGSEDYTEMAEWPLPPAPDPDVSSVAVHGFRWCDSGTGHLGSGDECSLLCASCSVSSMIRTLGREGTCMSVQVIQCCAILRISVACRLSRRKPTPPANKHKRHAFAARNRRGLDGDRFSAPLLERCLGPGCGVPSQGGNPNGDHCGRRPPLSAGSPQN